MPTIRVANKKSVTLENSEHDPITLNGLYALEKAAEGLGIPGDTLIEFTLDELDGTTVESISITENVEETR